MSNVRLFHGTSWESAQKIIRNGFKYGHNIWDVSSPTGIYLMDERYETGSSFADSENIPSGELPAFQFALQAGQMAAAYKNSQSDKIVVFELSGDEPIMQGFGRDVSSDEGTYMENSWDCDAHLLNCLIFNGAAKLTIHTIHNGYEPGCRYLYLASVYQSLMTLETAKEIDIQQAVANMLDGAYNFYPSDITREYMHTESKVFDHPRDWVINEEHRRNRD